MKFPLATRRSNLARWQADRTSELLGAAWSDLEPELVEVESSGDRDQVLEIERFGRIGVFTVEVDRAVVDGRARAAVHSLKDLTTELVDGVRLAAVLGRGPVEDALVSRDGRRLAELPAGARVATGSQRRAAMLRAQRPDLEIVGIRGNVETRLQKLAAGAAEAIVLARAGLVRLGLEHEITEVLNVRAFVPAVGQGIVGLVCRRDDAETLERLRAVCDLETWHEALCERAFLAELRGGCNVPIGGHARVVENTLSLRGRVLALDGSRAVEGSVTGPRDEAEELGRQLAAELLQQGARELVEAARA